MKISRGALRDLGVATACWLLLAVSIGWYYTVTYFGRVGWPMPSVETVGALLLYYFSVLNVDTEIQALHWLIAFPLAGFIWTAILPRTYRGTAATQPSTHRLAMRLALTSLPLSLPMPYMMLVAGQANGGWQFQRMIDVALRRGNVSPWPWLSPMYLVLGLVAFGLHVWVFRHSFPQAALPQLRHFLVSCIAFVFSVAVIGALASYPLRALLE